MKTYENIIGGLRYWYCYDRSLQSWTVFTVDDQLNIGKDVEYFANKTSLLANYDFDFKTVV